jgi:hypothetical protein
MSDVFCPEGFIPVETAILKVANRWFPESLETAVPQLATSDGNIEAAVQALRQLKRGMAVGCHWADNNSSAKLSASG